MGRVTVVGQGKVGGVHSVWWRLGGRPTVRAREVPLPRQLLHCRDGRRERVVLALPVRSLDSTFTCCPGLLRSTCGWPLAADRYIRQPARAVGGTSLRVLVLVPVAVRV